MARFALFSKWFSHGYSYSEGFSFLMSAFISVLVNAFES
jgi:hypothetical protein